MTDMKDLGNKANEVKEKAEEVLQNSGESIRSGLKKAGEDFAGTEAGKAILGEDGKLDKEDVDRLSSQAQVAAKAGVDKIKGLFNNDKKEEDK